MTESTTTLIECKSTRDPLLRLGFLVAMLVGFGLWCVYEMNLIDGAPKYSYKSMSDDFNTWATWAFNFYGQFVFTGLGLLLAWKALKFKNQVLTADDAGVGYVGREKIAWADVIEMDLSKFKAKEIMVLKAGDTSITLDGWKLQNFRDLIAKVEAALPDVKRTGV